MPKVIGQPKPEIPAPDNLGVLELKANLNSEQRAHLEVLKDKMKKTLAGKTKQELAKAGDLATLKKYKVILEEILEFLQTKEVRQSELERKFELKKQYEEQFKILRETGVIKELSDGRWGIVDILNQEQPIPSYEEIRQRIEAKAEMLDKKREQGFTQLLLVPIGMKLEDLSALAAKLILKKHQEGNLFGMDFSALELNENQPVYTIGTYKDADIKGDLVYEVKKFDKDNNGGKTKAELIKETGGWQIMFIEDMPLLPGKGKGEEMGDRKQLEAGQSPEEYLVKIQTDPQYADEQFTTPEAQLIYFIQYLQNNNRVIDDWAGKGKICLNTGAYFKGIGSVPYGTWNRRGKQFCQSRFDTDTYENDRAVRSSVII